MKRRRDSVSSACKRRIADDRLGAKRRGGSHQFSSQMKKSDRSGLQIKERKVYFTRVTEVEE